jgi:GDP-4-dehydro-6-deoxy-D-mannose reductase
VRALVTGAGGFVGGHLTAHLRESGDEVVESDRATGGPDIGDPAAMIDLVRDAAPSVVYHLAGQADVAASWRDPITTLRINAEGTFNVLAACAEIGVDRVLVVSSAEVYGLVDPVAPPITEDRPLDPASPYAASKAAAEMICIQWAHQGLGVVRARAFNHLGPGQSEAFVAPAIAGRLVRARAQGADHISVGNLSARRDFTDVRDVVRAYRLLATVGTPGEAYNVCSGVHRSIAELVDLLLELTGRSVRLEPDPTLQRPSDLPLLVGDATKIREQTGWAPTISFAQTLADLLAAATIHAAT